VSLLRICPAPRAGSEDPLPFWAGVKLRPRQGTAVLPRPPTLPGRFAARGVTAL